ncbi:UNVERIFIED_CONTAM: hypothetical protein HDU68_002598 [Siphonaria sp. JEL0065]|nr:hypothetical protein HDU68_002598 [Siphonaria sp. JEL0065]
MLKVLVVGATGGLGQQITREALKRGHTVSVMVRSSDKLNQTFNASDVSRLAHVHIGDGSDATTLSTACLNNDVILNAVGSRPEVARAIATAAVSSTHVKKLIHIAGATNVLSEDGSKLEWTNWVSRWSGAENAFKTHQAGIDAIRETGINYVVFCPGFMKSAGTASIPPVVVRVNRPSGDFVSYEDAAVVMVDAVEKSEWDRQLITAATGNSVSVSAKSE